MDPKDNTFEFKMYLASLAHDMKNAIGMLLNTTDEVLNRCASDTCPSYPLLSKLQYESKRINNNLIQLLTLYKMDKAELTVNVDYHSVRDFIEDAVLYNKPLLDSKGVQIEVDCPEDLSAFFDRDLVGGVINNILNNTYRYTKDTIRISAQKKTEDYLVIQIADNGTGYPEHMVNRVPDTPMKSNFFTGGTGLGLYFAYSVVKLHKNKGRTGYVLINNDSKDGGGCFSIYLP